MQRQSKGGCSKQHSSGGCRGICGKQQDKGALLGCALEAALGVMRAGAAALGVQLLQGGEMETEGRSALVEIGAAATLAPLPDSLLQTLLHWPCRVTALAMQSQALEGEHT